MSRGYTSLLALAILGIAYLLVKTVLFFEPDRSIPIDHLSSPVVYIDYPDGGQRIGPSESELMMLDLATGRSWQLTDDAAYDYSPSWSPSGSHVLFLSSRSFHPIIPWPRDSGSTGLFKYDLDEGAIIRIDLSWLRDHKQVGVTSAIDQREGWLDCASWAPSDSTVIYLGVTVGGPAPFDLSPQPERLLVKVDMESKSVDVLSKISQCSNLWISPNGRYVSGAVPLDAQNKKWVSVFDQERREWNQIDVSEPNGPSRPQYPLNWVGDGRLALYASGERSINYVYAVDLETTDATPVDTLQLEDFEFLQAFVSPVLNADPGIMNQSRPDWVDPTQGQIIIDKRVGGHISDDLFLHDISTGTRTRLTSTMYPKSHVRPR
jgi:dipeptidyl aminopeptidase/acylaminoacyl peptidase